MTAKDSTTGDVDKEKDGWAKELFKIVFYSLLIAMGFRTFLFEPFNIPSGSMVPTLLVGDYILVSKYTYGYSRHSFPWSLGPFNGRIFDSPVERGDTVVFKWPCDNRTDYIKRVVGVPGDRIAMVNGLLYINGQPVQREFIGPFKYIDQYGGYRPARMYEETMPSGESYYTLESTEDYRTRTVPDGFYFVMGDNRDRSADSRKLCRNGVGLVPAENIVGRAEVIFFSTNGTAGLLEVWNWPESIRWDRLFSDIQTIDYAGS